MLSPQSEKFFNALAASVFDQADSLAATEWVVSEPRAIAQVRLSLKPDGSDTTETSRSRNSPSLRS